MREQIIEDFVSGLVGHTVTSSGALTIPANLSILNRLARSECGL